MTTTDEAREALERYRIGFDVNRQRWFVYDRETGERAGRSVQTRDEAITRADRMNEQDDPMWNLALRPRSEQEQGR